MTASVIAVGMAPVGAGLTGSDTAEVQHTEIDDALTNADGTVEMIVQLDDVDEDVIRAQGADALQAHADDTQEVVTDFAEDTDGVTVLEDFWITNAMIVELDTDQVDVDEIAALDGVQELTKNFEVQLPDEPDSVSTMDDVDAQDTTYGLAQVNAPDVWEEFGVEGEGATVSVLDTGIDGDHPDLGALTQFAEFDDQGNVVSTTPRESDDRSSHGTHVSGTVAGGDASGTAIGVAPGVDLMNGLVLDGGQGSAGAILGGMEWSVEEGADVISMSLGTDSYNSFFIDPIQNAQSAGTMVISASGNSGQGTSGSPANVYDGMAIGATDSNEQVTGFSSGEVIDTDSAWGADADPSWPAQYIVPDVSAPGANVQSAVQGGGYSSLDGTSMATPHVSGVVGLMISAAQQEGMEFGEDYTISDVEDALEETAFKPAGEDPDQDDRYGHGIVDALAATEELVGSGTPPDAVEFDLGSDRGEEGDVVTLDLTAEGEEFAGYETAINFDADAVELVGVEGVDMDDPVTNIDNNAGVASMSMVSSSAQSDITVAELQFQIVTDVEQNSDVMFEVSDTEASDEQGNLLDVETDDGHIEIDDDSSEYERGDVLGDGDVTIADATVTQQFVLGNEVPDEFSEERADLTGDGDVTTADVIEILEIIVSHD